MNPYQVVRDFESALCDYTGAKYAVTVTSCTMALLLACRWHWLENKEDGFDNPYLNLTISIPKHTYVSVPQSIKHAGFDVSFRDEEWSGLYSLDPLPVWDSARFFSSNMYKPGSFMCCSFHWTKILSIGQGGCILHDNDEADKWYRKARFDGRTEGVQPAHDDFNMVAYHCYMSPRDAAEGISRLAILPKQNAPLPNDDYPDLSTFEIFQ